MSKCLCQNVQCRIHRFDIIFDYRVQSQVTDISVYVNCQNIPVIRYTSMYMYELLKTMLAGSTSPGNFSRSVFPPDLEPRIGYSPKTMRKVHACSCSWKLLGFSKLLLSWVWPWVMLQGRYSTKFYMGRLSRRSNPLPFYTPFLQKRPVSLLYTFYWQMVSPSCV